MLFLLPDYKSSEMVQTEKRKVQVATVRKKLVCSYYKFKQIIQAKAKRYDCLTVTCTEDYTSQTYVAQKVVALTISR
jgi:transposase